MDTTTNLLDKCREIRSIASDNALAAELGVTRATVSGWRHGKSHPDAVSCERIARITGMPLARVLGIVGEARAISAEEKKVWRRLAAVAAVVVMLTAFAAPSMTYAKVSPYSVYYVIFATAAFVTWRALHQQARC